MTTQEQMNPITIIREGDSAYSETRRISDETFETLDNLAIALNAAEDNGLPSWVGEQLRGIIKRLLGLKLTVLRLIDTPEGVAVVLAGTKKRKAKAKTPENRGKSLAQQWREENPEWRGSKSFSDGSYALRA